MRQMSPDWEGSGPENCCLISGQNLPFLSYSSLGAHAGPAASARCRGDQVKYRRERTCSRTCFHKCEGSSEVLEGWGFATLQPVAPIQMGRKGTGRPGTRNAGTSDLGLVRGLQTDVLCGPDRLRTVVS